MCISALLFFQLLNVCMSSPDAPSAAPAFVEYSPAPDILHVSATSTKTSIEARVILSDAGTVFCAVFDAGTLPLSSTAVTLQQHFASILSASEPAVITIAALESATRYDVYCSSRSSFGEISPYIHTLETKLSITTACCKEVQAILAGSSFEENKDIPNLLSISLNAMPAGGITISLIMKQVGDDLEVPDMLFPSQLTWSEKTWAATQTVTLIGSPAGSYSITTSISGNDEASYEVIFRNDLSGFVLQPSDVEPPTPSLTSAIFSSDGSSIYLSFDSSTDRAGLNGVFTCSLLLTFSGSASSRCLWTSDSALTITLGGTDRVGVNGNLTVLGNSLRPACALSDEICSSWTPLEPENNQLQVTAPSSPMAPKVAVSAPVLAGPCDAPVLDLTSSTGSGGRDWASVSITVQSQVPVDAVQTFFDDDYELSPPTPLPRGLLEAGNTYNFQIEMCNFLTACSAVTHQLTVSDDRVPVVSIQGQQVRNVARDVSLLLQSQGYIAECDGTKVFSGLEYSWKILKNGVADNSVVSIATDPKKFRLSPYTLSSRSLYEISITATSTASQLSATSSVQVLVERMDIVPAIAGGIGQSVRLGESLVLDASGSYDADNADRSDKSGLLFSWKCYQTKPSVSSSCGLGMDVSGDRVTLSTASLPAVGSVFAVSVTVSDATRESVETVYVTIDEADAPSILLTRKTKVAKINPSSQLVLQGSVEQAIPLTAVWSVDDPTVDLTARTKTGVSVDLPAGTNSIFMVLSANSLVGKSVPYVFSLSAGGVTSSLAVVVNTAPSPGSFKVTPSVGTAMTTQFLFTAEKWSDDDIPISYEFGFFTKVGSVDVVRGRAESTFSSSTLAAGSSAGNVLVCRTRIFDFLDAFEIATVDITVNDLVISTGDLQTKISEKLAAGEGDINTRKETIAVASSVLNSKDCSTAPDCSELFRGACSTTPNTCGSCLSGYTGNEGDDNSACVLESELDTVGGETACSADSDCTAWQYCDSSGGLCARKSKECINDCSGNGKCVMVLVDSGTEVESCSMGDNSCEAVCECGAGYGGFTCQMSEDENGAKKAMRQQLLDNLRSLAEVDDPTEDSVASWQSALNSITLSPDELSLSGSEVALEIASQILTAADDLDISYESLLNILNSIDAATIASASSGGGRRVRRRLTEVTETILLLDSFATKTAGGMVVGQSAENSINKMFRMTTQVLAAGGVVSLPQTTAESLSGVQPSSCSINSDSSQKISVISIKAKLYGDDEPLNSNALRIRFVESNLEGDVPTVTVVIQNSAEKSYPVITGTHYVNTTCVRHDISEYTHLCPGPLGGYPVTHKCNGSATFMESLCPNATVQPKCKIFNSAFFGCEVVSYTSAATTCVCAVSRDADGNRRSLDALEDSGALEVATVSEMVVDDFKTTISSAGDFNSLQDVKKTLTVLLMYGFMWAGGLLGVFICSMRHTHKSMKADAIATELQRKKDVAASTRSKEAIRSYLTAYVDEIFPSVFQSSRGAQRLWNEISKHHRYLLLFTARGKNAETIRIVTCIHLLTIQSMLMFILAVCYDIQIPNDDGTCATFDRKSDCLHDKSPFDSTKSLCQWSQDSYGDYECSYVDAGNISMESIIIISIVVALFTAPINLLVDFLFIEIISAPSADALKTQNQSAVRRVMKRVSNAGRRISAASIQTAGALRKSIFGINRKTSVGKFEVDTTRVVPDSAAEAQILATQSVGALLDGAKRNINDRVSMRRTQRMQSKVMQVQAKHEAKEQRKYASFVGAKAEDHEGSDDTPVISGGPALVDRKLREKFAELCVDIGEQRKLLKRSQQEGFDTMWGVDPTGEFSQQRHTSFYVDTQKSSEDVILSEMKFVRKEVQSKYEKLRFATDVQTGVEILHLFVMDLLGRDTPVAKIFLTKSEEDFRHSMVVSDAVKAAAWVAVVILNLFFVYFSMLRGLERGQKWQNLFLMACILQILIEVIFYETSECAIVHYYVPSLARKEVQSASFTLHQAVQKICSSAVDNAKVVLDAPRYLFVSTNLAQRFPDLLESVIVQSYHTYSPGELSKKWNISHGSSYVLSMNPWARSNRRVRRFTLYAVFINLMQRLGATSPILQRVIIHSLQPIFVSAVCLVLVVFKRHPYYSIIVGPFIWYGLLRLYDDYKREKLEKSNQQAYIHPDTVEQPMVALQHASSEDQHDTNVPRPGSGGSSGSGSKDTGSRRSSSVHPGDDIHSELPVLKKSDVTRKLPVKVIVSGSSSEDECKDVDIDSSDNGSGLEDNIAVVPGSSGMPSRSIPVNALVDFTSDSGQSNHGMIQLQSVSESDSSLGAVPRNTGRAGVAPLVALSDSEEWTSQSASESGFEGVAPVAPMSFVALDAVSESEGDGNEVRAAQSSDANNKAQRN